MSAYVSVDGVEFTDDDVERWADEAEAGFPGAVFSESSPGRPVSVGLNARPFTIRLDDARRSKIDRVARDRRTTASEVVRGLIDVL